MTQTLAPTPVQPSTGLGRSRRLLRAVAIVSCGPYLALKVAWLAGSRIGIPDGSPLLEHRASIAVANGITVLMDAAVIVLALVLTRPWGLRVPAWLLALPAWVATGLLAPLMAGFPIQLLVSALGGTVDTTDGAGKPFLDTWVFGVVYTGFIVQGLTLGALFVLYARDRWGHLWQGRIWELPVGVIGAAQRMVAVAAAVLALLPLTAHVLWACGSTAGLGGTRIADRTSDFYVMEVLYTVFLAMAVTGASLLAFRRGRALSVKVPLALVWVGSAALVCWAGWLSLAPLTDITDGPTALMNLAYAGEMIVGILVACLGVHFLAERSASRKRRTA
ncbi:MULTISPECIES: hypothetical protein [unclassified Streptomyces]|uniref:hypothetical protein n=1 Tax=unclassified Streptomyces TaxID=2593676 RepID=UPI002365240A|nr:MULTISPECIES: hypothetical protein [unclassified Streptomyces]MDF3149079.1 hypothetical protein [Streptomyces sp. T21Q-yed]WDF37159.1 hypothetical protein PBV52_10370 [Streptomyces sp. T12]